MTQILDDLRVVDLSAITAGAGSTVALGDFGADVIKIESVDRPDSFRGRVHPDETTPEARIPLAGPFTTVNRNKRAIAVDLKRPEGLEVVRRLVAISDVVVENFRRGVIERLGLGFDELVKIQPRIVLATISSQGATGPRSRYGSFGSVLDALGGPASITGYDIESPRYSSGRVNFPDQLVSMYAPGLILAGVLAARARDEAVWVDLSQRELTTSVVGEYLLQASVTGVDPEPRGNRGDEGPEWVSRAEGDDEWIAISLPDGSAWRALCVVIERPDLADSYTVAPNDQGVADIESATAKWSETRDKHAAMQLLQAAGIPAAAVRKSYELHDDEYLRSIGFFRAVDIPPGRSELQRGFLVRFENGLGEMRRRAPFLGEHTTEVLTELLGYSATEVDELKAAGVLYGH
ncbi:MAG: CoA transferase [Actinobacteria bacterium]|nr:CoA transferase [Actinomycetota bacterium]